MTKKKISILITTLFITCILAGTSYADGILITPDLWLKAVIHTYEKGPVEAVWRKGGEDTNPVGDKVIWGYFFADPDDVSWGSEQNPDLFVKIWFDRSGRVDVNYFHVSVPDIAVYSGYPYAGEPDEFGLATLSKRYIRQYYENGQSDMEERYEDGSMPTLYEPRPGGSPSGYPTNMGIMIAADINTREKGAIEAIWRKGGEDTTVQGDKVIWGYFHANKNQVAWGSENNPEVFVKLWADEEGRADVNFFHVSVPDIWVYSDFPYDKGGVRAGPLLMDNRYIRHEYRLDISPSVEEQNKFVYEIMKDTYLWYDKVPKVDYKAYDSPQSLLEDIKYKESDKWSHITSSEEHYACFEDGKYIGLGFSLGFDRNGDCRIRFVYEDSPAEKARLNRGDKLLEINEKEISEIRRDELWETITGPDETHVSVNLKIEDSEGEIRELSVEKDWLPIDPILYDDIVDRDGLKIGYLVFNTFLEAARDELETIFANFRQEDIDELVLDLRYNQGGDIRTAQYLASLIAGDHAAGKVFAKSLHNEKYKKWNDVTQFTRPENSLNMDRVLCITTAETCSASELVMNSLKPFVDVIPIGEKTCGKPFGMYGWDYSDIHFRPVEFRVVNAYNQGDYVNGIPPECAAGDDLTRPLGDVEEAVFRQALHYITEGVCKEYPSENQGEIEDTQGIGVF